MLRLSTQRRKKKRLTKKLSTLRMTSRTSQYYGSLEIVIADVRACDKIHTGKGETEEGNGRARV